MIEFKKHQQYVINYFKKYEPNGILLYHGLGSGKTITAIGICELYKKKVICIVPASMRTQWQKELKKFGISNKKYNIMSYEEFSQKIKNEKDINNKIVIIDEAHRLRNKGVISESVIQFTKGSYKIILLSGTPMVNGPLDFANLANLIYKETIIPTNQSKFTEKYMILETKTPISNSKKCLLYSPFTCSDSGFRYKNSKYCSYHLYLANRRSPLKYRKEINFKRDLKYEKGD